MCYSLSKTTCCAGSSMPKKPLDMSLMMELFVTVIDSSCWFLSQRGPSLDEIGSELSDFSESSDTEDEDFMPGNNAQVEESESEVTAFCFIKFAFSKFAVLMFCDQY